MLRAGLTLLLLVPLAGCLCLPENGEGVDTSYFSNCWDAAKSGPRNQVLFPRS